MDADAVSASPTTQAPRTIAASYPLELHSIKALFIQQQYRHCATACRELLRSTSSGEDGRVQPLRSSFLQFYLALSHDELARSIHNYSQSKLSAFNQAEILYQEALQSLPTAEQCLSYIVNSWEDDDNESLAAAAISRYPSSTTLGITEDPRISLTMRPSPVSPHIRDNSLATSPGAILSPGTTGSDFDDLESHESYDQIMTPSRIPRKLERDFSSMSLIQPQPQHVSHGLMRQIRVGEAAKRYHVPPLMPYAGAGATYEQPRLSRLRTTSSNGSPVRNQLRTPSEQDVSRTGSPVPPVSPVGSDIVASNASTISSISPDTPVATTEIVISKLESFSQRSARHLNDNLERMRVQLESHIKLVQEARQRTVNIQSERAAARSAPTNGGSFTALIDAAATDRRIQQAHSFWTFTPADTKALEKQRRIEAGRERGWARVRFDPTKYRVLAERALAEL